MPQLLFLSAAQLRLPATFSFELSMTISNVFSSFLSDSTCQIASPFAKPQDSPLVGSNFYFFQLVEFCELHQEYCSALSIGQDNY